MLAAPDRSFASLSPLQQRQAQQLLRRLQRLVSIEHVHTRIADVDYPWTRVVDTDPLLESALRNALRNNVDECVEQDPFWAATWRAAIGLDHFLSSFEGLDGLDVLELGGGSGRAGISAALRGARVCITDASNMALLICRYNARFLADRVAVRRLEWSQPTELHRRYSLILGSDIVYNPNLYPILEPCMRQAVADDGVVLLSEPQRHTGDRFEKWIRAAGWRCDSTLLELGDDQRAIRIFQCRLA